MFRTYTMGHLPTYRINQKKISWPKKFSVLLDKTIFAMSRNEQYKTGSTRFFTSYDRFVHLLEILIVQFLSKTTRSLSKSISLMPRYHIFDLNCREHTSQRKMVIIFLGPNHQGFVILLQWLGWCQSWGRLKSFFIFFIFVCCVR